MFEGDNSSFLVFNRDPVDHMIEYLTTNFPETTSNDSRRSLAIRAGSKGQQTGVYILNFKFLFLYPPPLHS